MSLLLHFRASPACVVLRGTTLHPQMSLLCAFRVLPWIMPAYFLMIFPTVTVFTKITSVFQSPAKLLFSTKPFLILLLEMGHSSLYAWRLCQACLTYILSVRLRQHLHQRCCSSTPFHGSRRARATSPHVVHLFPCKPSRAGEVCSSVSSTPTVHRACAGHRS